MREIERESRRLRRAFSAVLALALPGAAVSQACSSSSNASATDGPDATVAETGGDDVAQPGEDAKGDQPQVPLDDGACSTYGGFHDADPDAPDVDQGCYYTLPCGFGDSAVEIAYCQVAVAAPDAGPDAPGTVYCNLREGDGCQSNVYTPGANGRVTIDCADCFGGGGRRPVGLARARPRRAHTMLGAYFAQMAHEEAASVHAFERMHAELTHFGAPRSLLRAAKRSTRDEIRHARVMSALASANGAEPARARVRKPRVRKLEAVARENAIEGCVNETWGALLMAWQAERAADPELRAAFARIAADESRHAALSWALARFAEGRLDPAARRRVASARARATRSLRAAIAQSPQRAFDAHVGRPSPREALALFDALERQLAA
ncbi:MAG TPA: ferritin-like domain-containing protein [Labilithrix sp.]